LGLLFRSGCRVHRSAVQSAERCRQIIGAHARLAGRPLKTGKGFRCQADCLGLLSRSIGRVDAFLNPCSDYADGKGRSDCGTGLFGCAFQGEELAVRLIEGWLSLVYAVDD